MGLHAQLLVRARETGVKTHLTHVHGELRARDRVTAAAAAYDRVILG